MDKITVERIKLIHPKLLTELIQIYGDINCALTGNAICRFAFTYRSNAEQDALYRKGRTEPGPIVTYVKGGASFHNYGLAVDIVILVDKDGNGSYETASWDTRKDYDRDLVSDWIEIVNIFKAYGWEWGGNWNTFPDYPHFQKTFGKSTQELKLAPKIPGTIYPVL